jgi:hypothetical protein
MNTALTIEVEASAYFKKIKFDPPLLDPALIPEFQNSHRSRQLTFKRPDGTGEGMHDQFERAKTEWLKRTKSKFCSDLISCLFKSKWMIVHTITVEQKQITFTLTEHIEWTERETEKIESMIKSLWAISNIPQREAR